MWRAFFFAVGTMLIILGLECLVTDSFVVRGARIPGLVAKIFDGSSKQPITGTFGTNPSVAQGSGYQNPSGAGVSSFGPSRFSDNFAGSNQPAGNYYGGAPSGSQGYNGNSQFSLAGFGRQQSDVAPMAQLLAGSGTSSNSTAGRQQNKILHPKDWMPWSLLAAGSLIVLYTNTTVKI